MAEPITIQQLTDASIDTDSLEVLVNGDENTDVNTRLGETYPSAKKAINTLFTNGGLPAKPFTTKALMTASTLANGSYAQVTDETTNNGLYLKTNGAWVKSGYDPVSTANTYADSLIVANLTQGFYESVADGAISVGTGRAAGFECLEDGNITGFKLENNGGTTPFKFQIYSKSGSQLTLKHTQDLSIVYPNFLVTLGTAVGVNKGDIVAVTNPTSGNFKGMVTTAVNGSLRINDAATTVGQVSDLANTNNTWRLQLEVYIKQDKFFAKSDLITTPVAEVVKPKYSKVIINERFAGAALPTGWTQVGGWVVSDGLKSPTTGGATTVALSQYPTVMANRVYRATIKVTNANSVFGLCLSPHLSASGGVAMLDGVAKKLIIYPYNSAVLSASVAEIAIPTLVAGRRYLIEVQKEGNISTVTLTDKVTLTKTELKYSNATPYMQFHGKVGVMFMSGDITVEHIGFNALYPEKLQAILLGDSNGERANNVGVNSTWLFQLAAMREMNGDIMVAAISSENTSSFKNRVQLDLKSWQAKYVVWSLGTNDGSHESWRTKTAEFIADCLSIGAEPILTTYLPYAAKQAQIDLMNADIKNKYFGNYRYIDLASAVSLNNDGITWNPLYNGDGIHVNQHGQDRLLEQAIADVPDLIY